MKANVTRHYSTEHRQMLHKAVAESIDFGLKHGCACSVDVDSYPASLRAVRASFVTLELGGALRGCIGSLQARQPLICDVSENAYNAAFRDPRFPPLSQQEFPELEVHISVLSEPEPLPVSDRADLMSKLRPGCDGLILSQGPQRATFLPSVWDQLPDPVDFIDHLLLKAGFPNDYWSPLMQVQRYHTECF